MAAPRLSYKDFITDPARDCAIIVHRGMWQDAPENSLLAIERAIAGGYDVVEIDVRRSADGELFLLHDETLERMTGVNRIPEEMPIAEITTLQLRNRDGGPANAVTSQTVPTLREVFELTRDKVFIHLDIKDRTLLPEVIACAQQMGVGEQMDYWGDLRNQADLDWVQRDVTPYNVLFMAKTRLNRPDTPQQLDLLFRLNPAMCEIYFDTLEQIATLHRQTRNTGMTLWYNTLDDVSCAGFTDTAALNDPEAIWGQLLDAGISAIQTDYAAELKAFLTTRGREQARA